MQWLCFQDGTGECWTWSNPQIRAQKNITHGREYISPFYNPSDVAFPKKEEDHEEIQEQESSEECEESSEEEDSEDNYFIEYVNEKRMREAAEKSISDFMEKLKKMEDDNDSIKATKRAIFDLQDLIMRLIKFKKIDKDEVEPVLNILRNTGVEEVDIKVLCHLPTEEKNERKSKRRNRNNV